MEVQRKISTKTVIGSPNEIRALATKGGTPLYTVYGMASKTKRGEDEKTGKPWVALIGRFEAARIADGVISTAPQVFLPSPMDEMLAAQLELTEPMLDTDGKPVLDVDGKAKTRAVNNSVQFALEISVKLSETVIGYEYVTKSVIEPTGADPLADLRKSIPKLPSPKK